uniref:Probable endolytic peptidoglycan transglycosylase RlpA n=1 Tax=Nitratidesulfovibrio vulgaris (strain DSM 19637 / Miyazaki F) TaxID=883 RepID=B8DRV7_NITV9
MPHLRPCQTCFAPSRLIVPTVLLLLAALLMAGCGFGPRRISTPPSDQSVKYPKGQPQGPRAKPYTVLGKTYHPLLSAHGFSEEGIASWYGKDFHGRKTANGEIYDMYGLTAAHKLLPFNTVVKVTNLQSGRSTTVRVNDRGPFVGDRIIDLTNTAANQIGMLGPGTARVRVETVGDVPGLQDGDMTGRFYVQVGAFSNKDNASRLVTRLQGQGWNARMYWADMVQFWRVQVGPWGTLSEAERMREKLKGDFAVNFVVAD